MNNLPNCPVCGEDSLRLYNYDTESGLHYSVGCDACGVAFHHEGFYGYNNVMAFFEGHASEPELTEDVSTKNGIFKCRECGCTVEEHSVDYGEINFCPDCGKWVEK